MKGVIHHHYQVLESIAEEPTYAHRNIDTWASKFFQRYHFQTAHTPALFLPCRAHTDKRKNLRYVVSVRPHRRSAPHAYAHRLRVLALVSQVALHQRVRKLLANLPRSFRWDAARVHRVEIAPGRQHTRHPSCWCASGPRRYEPPVEAPQQSVNLVRSLRQRWVDALAHVPQHIRHISAIAKHFLNDALNVPAVE